MQSPSAPSPRKAPRESPGALPLRPVIKLDLGEPEARFAAAARAFSAPLVPETYEMPITDPDELAAARRAALPQPKWRNIRTNLYQKGCGRQQRGGDACGCLPLRESESGGGAAEAAVRAEAARLRVGVNCDEDCLNRALHVECDRDVCPAGDLCANRRFQSRNFARVKIAPTPGLGWGLFAAEPLARGQLVIEYCGEVIDDAECAARLEAMKRDGSRHFHMLQVDGVVIDAGKVGNRARFMNHCCEPNVEAQKWTVAGLTRVGFFALRDVTPGEQITFDYQLTTFSDERRKCLCGTPSCRGFIDEKADRRPEAERELDEAHERQKARLRSFKKWQPPKTTMSLSTFFYSGSDEAELRDAQAGGVFLLRSTRAPRGASNWKQRLGLESPSAGGLAGMVARLVRPGAGGGSNGHAMPLYRRSGLLRLRQKRLEGLVDYTKRMQLRHGKGRDYSVALQIVQSVQHERAGDASEVAGDAVNSDLNDSRCSRCGAAGDLLLCDKCPAAFHVMCVGLAAVPAGDWFCARCDDKGGERRERQRRRRLAQGVE